MKGPWCQQPGGPQEWEDRYGYLLICKDSMVEKHNTTICLQTNTMYTTIVLFFNPCQDQQASHHYEKIYESFASYILTPEVHLALAQTLQLLVSIWAAIVENRLSCMVC